MGDKEVDIYSLNKYLLHVCYVSGCNREEVLLKALEIMEEKKWDSKGGRHGHGGKMGELEGIGGYSLKEVQGR